MNRLILFVEGHTEKQAIVPFLKQWLDARLDRPVGITSVRFEGWPQFVNDAPKKATFYLETDPKRSDTIAVIGLLDLYGPMFYPAEVTSAADKYRWGKAYIEGLVDQEKYHQFFAVHETEAWLLSDLSKFENSEVRAALTGALKSKSNKPEGVNFNEPPAKLLHRVYLDKTRRDYKKVTEAKVRFPKLDPDTACAKCPYLQQMLEAILEIVRSARGVA